jgi:hypothetical protein
MMRTILLAFAFLVFTLPSLAQTYYSSDPASAILFCGGITSSNVLNDTASSNNVVSLMGGLKYRIILSEKFNLNLGAVYTGKGYKREKPIQKFRYYYLDIPLYLQYHLVQDVRIDLGAQYSVFSMGNITVIDDSKSSGVNHQRISALRPNDYGLRAGINIKMHDNFDLAAQYYLSLSALQKAASPGDFSVFNVHLQYYMVKFYNRGKKKDDPASGNGTGG